jgi:hypothetical protein
MAEYHPEMEIETPVVHPFKSAEERFYPSWWDRLLGRDRYMNKLNHRNAYIQHLEYVNITEIEVLRQGLIDLQPEKVLEQEGKYLDEIGVLKARVGGLESEVRTITRQNKEMESELAARKRQDDERLQRAETRVKHFTPEPTLIKPERAQSLGRGHVAPNSGAHATSGQIGSTPQDGGSGLLMQAAVLHTVLASDSAPTRSEAACSGYRDAYEAPARSEPAYCAPEPTRSEPSYTPTPDSPSSGDGGGGGCD